MKMFIGGSGTATLIKWWHFVHHGCQCRTKWTLSCPAHWICWCWKKRLITLFIKCWNEQAKGFPHFNHKSKNMKNWSNIANSKCSVGSREISGLFTGSCFRTKFHCISIAQCGAKNNYHIENCCISPTVWQFEQPLWWLGCSGNKIVSMALKWTRGKTFLLSQSNAISIRCQPTETVSLLCCSAFAVSMCLGEKLHFNLKRFWIFVLPVKSLSILGLSQPWLLESHSQRAVPRAKRHQLRVELGRPFGLLATTLFVLPVPIID